MNQTTLHDWHASQGARMVDFAGWHMPIQYTSIVDEHQAVRQHAGLFDISHMGRIEFSGPDHVAFLDSILTNHVAIMQPGQVRYALVCQPDGGILDDVLVSRFEQTAQLVVNASNHDKIMSWIDQHKDGFDCQINDQSLETSMLALQGPESLQILSQHTPADLTRLKYYNVLQSTVCGVDAIISRTGYTGEDGFEVIVDNASAQQVWNALVESGAPIGLRPCGLGCRDTLRLEAGMPLYGHEMDESVDPYTAGLGFAVKLNKEEFVGKAALLKFETQDDLLVRVGIELDGKRIARPGTQLRHGEHLIGQITSGTFSPTLEKSIGMGYVPKELSEPGTTLDVDLRGTLIPAHIISIPFYKRPKAAAKA